jgi:hypothetical protein
MGLNDPGTLIAVIQRSGFNDLLSTTSDR